MQNYDDRLERGCPICGKKVSMKIYWVGMGYEGKIECDDCHLTLSSERFDTEDNVADYLTNMWNKKRPTDPIHAHWTEKSSEYDAFGYRFICSNCHGVTPKGAFPVSPDFCPYCNAIMDEELLLEYTEIYAVDIKWDIDDVIDHNNADLRSKMFIPDDIVSNINDKDKMYEEISKYLTDVTGFYHKGFTIYMK